MQPQISGPTLGRRLRVGSLVVAVAIAVYVVPVTVYNAPASPAQIRLLPTVDRVVNPYFTQDWTLFAPMPPSFNEAIDLQARLKEPSGVAYTRVVNTDRSAQNAARSNRLLPTKLPDLLLGLQETFGAYAAALSEIQGAHLSAVAMARTVERLRSRFGGFFGEVDRFLSAEASVTFPGRHLAAVRGFFTETPIVPFSDRYVNPPPQERPRVVFVTRWMRYLGGIPT